ncbi:NAD-binding protein [Rickenella mellea]|uniref:NAD-binding protein n=1 Tax=Rickenella mellea TaxID=50990 RepID=A0A4Y7PWD5_9AGAM|nr:NAD-binding protein [Rickenella mellea]
MTQIFLLGATGTIGGSILVDLKKTHPEANIMALVRSAAHNDAVRAAGAEPVQGTFSDLDIIEEQASKADIVLNAAQPDDLQLANAILKGLKKRKKSGQGVPSYIHTSGTMIFLDGNKAGAYDKNAKVWTDSAEDIKLLTPQMFHGQVDVPLLKAGEEGYVNTYIICPSNVHGGGKGPVQRTTLTYRWLTGASLGAGAAFYLGEGSNVLGFVHIDDILDLYLKVVDLALSTNGPAKTSPYERYFIGSVEQSTNKELMEAIAKRIHASGKLPTAEPKSVTAEEAGMLALLGGNMLLKPIRGREIGWVPKGPSVYDTIDADLEAVLKSM